MKGFTLIEFLVVLAIIAVFSLLSIPAYQSYAIKSYRTQALANARICLSQAVLSQVEGSNYTAPPNCTISTDGKSCTCKV